MNQNRRARRSNVLMAASIEASGVTCTVKLRNLSAQGALIEGEGLPMEGTSVLFRRNDLAVSGKVAWVDGARAGIAFDMDLDPETVLRHIPQRRQQAPISYKRPGFKRELSPEERKLGEELIWGKPLPSLGD